MTDEEKELIRCANRIKEYCGTFEECKMNKKECVFHNYSCVLADTYDAPAPQSWKLKEIE